MKYHIITYGCQMNQGDSERIAAVLEKIGYRSAPSEKGADLIVVNACSVRQSAVDRIYGKINNLQSKITILTGCVLKKDKQKLSDKFDLILNIKDLNQLPKLLKSKLFGPHNNEDGLDYFQIFPKHRDRFTVYVPISTGCNNYCSYCVVPHTRGPEYSRPVKEIVNETRNAVKQGAKEIWLLGQNVNSYQFIDKNSSSEALAKEDKLIKFPKLLKIVNDIPGNFWIKFTSSHPKDMSDKLIEIMAKCEKICKYIHLPVQSGNNTILKKMNRHYTVAHYKNLIKKIRRKIPDVAISTDIIVGFPGETKKQFEDTAKLMREIKFDMAYLAQYSPRWGTAAAKLRDNVSKTEKKQREQILNEILKKTALENNKKYIGKTINVLINKIKKGFAIGKTKTYKTVKLSTQQPIPRGSILSAKITDALPWGLKGKIEK